MSSYAGVALLLAALALPSLIIASHEEDFAFDISDDLEVELDENQLGKWNNKEFTANVGRIFHLVIPKDAFGGEVKSYEVKKHGGTGLPLWLLFDKDSGIFWGVPLMEDVGSLHLTVRSIGGKSISEEVKVNVVVTSEEQTEVELCTHNEDSTILTLLLDKNIRAIKPKQRVIAVNNIAKFFGLPYSAFTLKPQIEKDDITDSSIVLAGPGNLHSRASKLTSLLQVPVGCDGRLWATSAPMVRQLKQQARDGTIAEVLRLPLIGWRVKTETKPALRSKRQISAVDDYGSGDYGNDDDYYEDYEDYGGDDLEPVEGDPPPAKIPPVVATVKTTTTTTTSTTETTTHPHRHHHGEINPSVPGLREHHQTTHKMPTTEENVPIPVPTTSTTTTTTERITQPPTTPSTTTTTTLAPTTNNIPESTTVKIDRIKPKPDTEYEEDYDYEAYDDEDDGDDPIESNTIVPNFSRQDNITPVSAEREEFGTDVTTTVRTTVKEIRTETVPITIPTIANSAPTNTPSTTTSTTTTTESPTTLQIVVDSEPEVIPSTETQQFSTTFSDVITPQQTTLTSSARTTITTSTPSSTSSTTSTTEAPTTQEETTFKVTTARHITTTPRFTTPIREVTDGIEFHENFDPFIENRLQQKFVIAGKIFRFVIPHDTFKDFEDEYNLTYELLDANNKTVRNTSWLQFNPARREVYGLPLEHDVSKWVFWVKAYDQEGGSVQDLLSIQVQQHKLDLVVNHEFSLHIRVEKRQEFAHYVDWSLKVLRALGKIYNTNMSEITVRHINYTSEPAIFTWSNDSLPIEYCAKTEIEKLYNILTANERGDPSRELNLVLQPELRVKKVIYRELGVCEETQTHATPPINPMTPPINFSPILRNPVDKINATVGELLVYKVRDDTFYDPEDVDPRMLNISLLTGDRKPIPPNSWLQFDSKNREFFGIPKKTSRSEYQLVCIDSGGLPATDSLEVIVYPPPKRKYNVEFSMNITEISYDIFVNSAVLQRKFVEKLMELFGDMTSDNIHLLPFKQTYDSTIVTWFNKSLTTEVCPHEEINRLESVLRNMNDKSISHRVHNIMEPEFRVSTIKVHLIDNCKPKIPHHDAKPEIGVPVEETAPSSGSDEYLITFIVPAVIISIMLFLATVAACVLYRRRRTGKMNVEEDGRQSYGNKGIPVIFQEELEEKPEPGTKAPVILKDEKPPLAPPEYSKSGSVKLSDDSEPYQPPPPFTRTQDNGRQPRPKPTPTYRKPPPYVPP